MSRPPIRTARKAAPKISAESSAKTTAKTMAKTTAKTTAQSSPKPASAAGEGGRPGARERRAAERRDAILTAALDEFSARGFAATRLDDVAKRAGVAKGTIYLYFADKEALFQELVRAEISPVVGVLVQASQADIPLRVFADRVIEVFAREVFETRRKDVVRLVMTEGARFPHLAEFYHREVLSRAFAAIRGLMQRAVERGELKHDALVRFPQLLPAPALLAIIWSGLFDRFEPLDVRALMRAHFDILFGGSAT